MSGPELSAEEGVGPSCQRVQRGRGKEARMACWADRPRGLGKELGRARGGKSGPRLPLGPERRRKGAGKDMGLRAENREGGFFFFYSFISKPF